MFVKLRDSTNRLTRDSGEYDKALNSGQNVEYGTSVAWILENKYLIKNNISWEDIFEYDPLTERLTTIDKKPVYYYFNEKDNTWDFSWFVEVNELEVLYFERAMYRKLYKERSND